MNVTSIISNLLIKHKVKCALKKDTSENQNLKYNEMIDISTFNNSTDQKKRGSSIAGAPNVFVKFISEKPSYKYIV